MIGSRIGTGRGTSQQSSRTKARGPVRNQRTAMLSDQPEVLHSVEGIVHRLTHDTAIQEDLIQDALQP